ncbi:hypothetical protein ACFLYF_03485 [Chloroflexota bacterium]
MTRQVKLLVNDDPIQLDYFVERFVDHTVGGMIASLEGTGEIETLDLSLKEGKVTINLNSTDIPANPFVSQIMSCTVAGMLSTLKGVGDIKKVLITIQR